MTTARRLRDILAGVALLVGTNASAQTATYDTLVRGGTILDGSGLPAYRGDVAIKDGHIVAVGTLRGARAATIIDATALMVAPGFINIHSHARPDAIATAVNMLTQGVTTEIANADGQGTTDITTQLVGFSTRGLAANIGLYIGFNAIWSDVVGADDRRATAPEIAQMRGLIDGNLAQGAWGVAAGLDYKPGYFADSDEVVSVVSAARKWRTNFPNHDRLRPEDDYSSYKGMIETIAIAEQAGLMPVITHMKTQGAEQGNARAVLAMLDAATARGTYTAADLYPYLAGQSGLTLTIPGWALAGGREAMLARFKDPALRLRIVDEAERAMGQRFGGPQGVYLIQIERELTHVIREMNVRPGEAVVRLLEQQDHNAILRFGAEADLVAFLKYPNSAMACDCGASLGLKGHPRGWGSFPRVLGSYVRKQGVLSWPEAIRKSTALPAAIIGMNDRGYLMPGMRADITIFDPKAVRDHATYDAPTKPSEGIRAVLVNGRVALRDGTPTGLQGGAAVLRSRHEPSRPMTIAGKRTLASTGTVTDATGSYRIKVAATQNGKQRFASGRLTVVDKARRLTWTATQLGTIQTAPGWTSLTAVLRDTAGNLHPATVTIDRDGAPAPLLIVRIDGKPDMTGPIKLSGVR